MSKPIALSVGFGEIVSPQTLVVPLVVSFDGTITADAGALHGRSKLEQGIRFVGKREEALDARPCWVVWVAVELDASDQPVRYRGIAASQMWIDPVSQVGYKVLADQVNRMSEAIRGGVNLKSLDAAQRSLIAKTLSGLGQDVWQRTALALKGALS